MTVPMGFTKCLSLSFKLLTSFSATLTILGI